ncbi:MAG TPA: arginine decarboxylase [Cyclobacteriaceae bacterium]
MKSYFDLVDQTFDFPTQEFNVKNNRLHFHEVNLMEIIKQYGTPLKLSYLPKISSNIQYAKKIFDDAIHKYGYNGSYTYCYCTKSSHFSFVIEEALKNKVHLETSSGFDLAIIDKLYEQGLIDNDIYIICNGFKRNEYKKHIVDVIKKGFINCVPILDNLKELDYYDEQIQDEYKIGIRIASDEEPNFSFYTSRLGIRYSDVIDFYRDRISESSMGKLKMLHFFINTGIKDTAYYWSELSRFVYKYCELKKICPDLDSIDIGGGFPIKNSLQFAFDYQYITEQIIENIKWICDKNNVPVPHIYTEFGSYTVGESGATIYSVLDQKLQNDKELWYMMDGSFITQMPDVWGLNEKFILLPINHWDNNFHKVNIGGLTCDSMDYYDSEAHISEVFLPVIDDDESLYFGFFHTGAYQESIGGYGGIQHCLIPSPKHVIIKHDENTGELVSELFAKEQTSDSMLHILGFNHLGQNNHQRIIVNSSKIDAIR